MIKKYTIFLCFVSILVGQISISDITSETNKQLDVLREELIAPVSRATPDHDIKVIEIDKDNATLAAELEPLADYFGYNYFKKEINFFDNIPTPTDFKLGPGDEVMLSLWGDVNSQETFVINKDGLIYYPKVGFINISNKTIKEAELILKEELSQTYSTLKDSEDSTKLMLDLGKLKSVNTYFSGQINNPGINLIHPFSDVFSAIVQAGGIEKEGSLRKVQLIRNGEIVSTIDFYSFFIDGKDNFSTIRILDGDVVHVPVISNRVEIRGEVYNTGFFELINGESLKDLITYTGGFTANASSVALLDIILPITERISDDYARISKTVFVEEFSNTNLYNGDSVTITSIGSVETKVEIFGQVKFPGSYPSTSNLKAVLDIAGGFDDPLYRKSIRDDEIMILRKDENQFYGLEFQTSYEKSDQFELIPEDKIFVYEDYKYNNNFMITIGGEVQKKGSFPLRSEMTVRQAINLAEGFTPLGNPEAIIVSQDFVRNNNGTIVVLAENVSDVTLDLILTQNATITVLPHKDMINIEGNVYNPGLIAYKQGTTVNQYIKLAGGYQKHSLKNKIYLQRANGKVINVVRGRFKRPQAGDTIFIPIDPNPPSEFDATGFTSDIVSILTNLATIIFIIDSNSN